ncbi:MAG: alanine racemase [Candidatus Adiutrix intracellularis]|jgi:alanine racemase|nr:MAG: alanine racemase [Candidatus Adiutrix intracellularis]MDR2826918.1 alanine racemase [Candidatus Adiutrix intracellularis]
MLSDRQTWVEIDLSAIQHNVRYFKSLLSPGTRFCAVVKANGYGHGATAVARAALAAGADYLAVADLDEALTLREAGFNDPILILGYTPPAATRLVVANDITQTIFSLEQAQALAAAAVEFGRPSKVHLKIDTGMGRLGVFPALAGELAGAISRLNGLELEGAFTHFAMADSADKNMTDRQLAVFKAALADIQDQGVALSIRHAANSAATLDLPETHLDMVRVGISLYGLAPSDECGQEAPLKPAMKLKTRVTQLKEVPAGTTISYGATYVTPGPARIATLPLGYADGWSRRLSGLAELSFGGRRAPIIGRICMDQCLAEVSGLPDLKAGDEVLLFGGPELPVEEVAGHLGTINYEVICLPDRRIPRVYI